MSFSRPIQWYHSHVDTIWPDGTGTFKFEMKLTFHHKHVYRIIPAEMAVPSEGAIMVSFNVRRRAACREKVPRASWL
jgi:hypothetical protein